MTFAQSLVAVTADGCGDGFNALLDELHDQNENHARPKPSAIPPERIPPKKIPPMPEQLAKAAVAKRPKIIGPTASRWCSGSRCRWQS